MNIETDAAILELVHELRSQAGQIYAQALHPVVEVGIDRLHHGHASTIKNVDGGDPAGIHIIKETAIAHPGNGGVAGGNGWARVGGSGEAVGPATEQLPTEEEGNHNRQEPESDQTPALIH